MAEVVKKEVPVRVVTAKVGSAYAFEPPQLEIEDILRIKKDPTKSLYKIPFGASRGMIRVRELPEDYWKGTSKKDGSFGRVARAHGNLAKGTAKCVEISKGFAGTKGVVMVTLPDGRVTFYPKKAWMQKKWREVREIADKVAEIDRLSVDEVIRRYGF